jgi:hypothetical protein
MVQRTFQRIASLPVTISGYALRSMSRPVRDGFVRVTTVVELHGAGQTGIGEDVTYDPLDHERFLADSRKLPVEGRWELAAFSALLDELELFAVPPAQYASRQYRRWAFESAALDLALRQLGAPLHAVLDREPQPMRFVASLRLGSPPTIAPIDALVRRCPNLRFKLDPTSEWSSRLCSALAALRKVDVVDLKGAYRGTPVDTAPDPELYERVVRNFEDAWLEDPHLDERTRPALKGHEHRITWDAPIHSIADIAALPFPPRMLNFKPSRFGSIRELFDGYDFCKRRGIRLYGGGQFELGPGRGQAQYLASMFHPAAPNDLAPTVYHDPDAAIDLPSSPLPPTPPRRGFRWGSDENPTGTG